MDGLPAIGDVNSPEQAVVAVVIVLGLLVWPGVLTLLAGKRSKDVRDTLTKNNGGSTVKDQLDRIERHLESVDQRLTALESPPEPEPEPGEEPRLLGRIARRLAGR